MIVDLTQMKKDNVVAYPLYYVFEDDTLFYYDPQTKKGGYYLRVDSMGWWAVFTDSRPSQNLGELEPYNWWKQVTAEKIWELIQKETGERTRLAAAGPATRPAGE